jgi:hypothetical protein
MSINNTRGPSRVEVPFSQALTLAGGSFTVELWARLPFVADAWFLRVTQPTVGTADGYAFRVSQSGTAIFAAGGGAGTADKVTSQAAVVTPGLWQHFATSFAANTNT